MKYILVLIALLFCTQAAQAATIYESIEDSKTEVQTQMVRKRFGKVAQTKTKVTTYTYLTADGVLVQLDYKVKGCHDNRVFKLRHSVVSKILGGLGKGVSVTVVL